MVHGPGTKTLSRGYFTNDRGETAVTIAIDRPSSPSVFDAGLPEINYGIARVPTRPTTSSARRDSRRRSRLGRMDRSS